LDAKNPGKKQHHLMVINPIICTGYGILRELTELKLVNGEVSYVPKEIRVNPLFIGKSLKI